MVSGWSGELLGGVKGGWLVVVWVVGSWGGEYIVGRWCGVWVCGVGVKCGVYSEWVDITHFEVLRICS